MRPSGHRSGRSLLEISVVIAILGCFLGSHPALAFVRNVFPPEGVAEAIAESSPGDSILVHPGIYTFEIGVAIAHSLTIIGVGGASDNEVRICTDLCPGAFLNVQSQAGLVLIQGLTLTRSHKYPGGVHGILAEGAQNLTVKDCTFLDLQYGYGIISFGSNARIEGSQFLGHGVRIASGGGEIIGNTFVNAGIRTGDTGPATPRFTRNIFYGTSVVCEEGDPLFACTNSWQSIYDGCPNLAGVNNNFTADPLFCDPDARDYRLLPSSPCLPENSPAGCDLIGANGPCEVLAVGEPAGVPSLSRLEVSPNPASGEVVFSIPGVTTPRTLEIFDANGRQVDVLRPMAGEITWNPGRNLTRGIYFARITSGTPGVVKFVLLR